jgi:hypothetical protein
LQVTISNQSGETLKTVNFKGEPLELCEASCKDDGRRSAGANKTVSSSSQQFTAAAALALVLCSMCALECRAACFLMCKRRDK